MTVEHLSEVLLRALQACDLPEPDALELTVPKQREHGDFTTNVALQLAKRVGEQPRALAERIRAAVLEAHDPLLDGVDVAGPGFLNLRLATTWLHDVLREVVGAAAAYGTGSELAGQRINLEFVSANPTGPLHAGGGRWVVIGDAIANLLAARGAEVSREYYLNDTGNQLKTFEASLWARYRQLIEPEADVPFPDDGYAGAYMVDLAAELRAEQGDHLAAADLCELGVQRIVAGVRSDLGRIGVHFDTWFSERTLHARGDVAEVLQALRAAGHCYEHDGAEWLRSTDFGDTRDRVLVRSDGTTTYLCNDLAYHRDKFARGFSHLINIWGADHHAQVKSLQVGLEALGFPQGEPEILLGQWVRLLRGGEAVKLSKRAGEVLTLADILDEIDPDVARMTFLLQSMQTEQTLDLVKVAEQSMENPVYYVQYAHARIASIGRRAAEQGVTRPALADTDLSLLTHEREHDLLRCLHEYPNVVADAAAARAPHKVSTWVRDLAGKFQRFYHDCRVLTDDAALSASRLWLVEACRIGLANALVLLGVSVPESMSRLDDDEPGAPGADQAPTT